MFEVPWSQLETHAKLYPELVVLFVMDECPHCPVMIGRMEKLQRKQKENKLLDVALVRLNEDRYGVLHGAKVRAFPTLQKYLNGKLTEVNFRPKKDPDDADLLHFMRPSI